MDELSLTQMLITICAFHMISGKDETTMSGTCVINAFYVSYHSSVCGTLLLYEIKRIKFSAQQPGYSGLFLT